jgi:cholesterol oxidase
MSHTISRRNFLRTGLYGAAGAALLGPAVLRSARAAHSEPVEAVIIGSGFGGAVAALRLARAGVRTVLLERGRRWPVTASQDTFATLRNPDGRAGWLRSDAPIGAPTPIDVYTGVLERTDEAGISVFAGAGVGGGSLVYNGVTYQPTRQLFDRIFQGALDYDEMADVYYTRVRSILQPSAIPADILASNFYLGTRVFLEEAANAGLPSRLLDLNVDWNVIREEIQGLRAPSAINGEFWYGNNSGFKNSLDKNYLADAEATGLVEVLPLHVVTEIEDAPGHRYTVKCRQIDESGVTLREVEFNCRHLFLAAGSVGTSKMLVKARAKGTLKELNRHVGEIWGNNGDFFGMQVGLPQTNPSQGGPAASAIEHHDNPFGPTVLLQFPQWDETREGALLSLGMGIAPPRGSFRYDPSTDSVKLSWPGSDPEIARVNEAAAHTYDVLNRANTNEQYQPSTAFVAGGATAHPLGGAVLGRACDSRGRVRGYQNLYVVDGALIPGATGCVNPSFTIAALAERCMDALVPEVVDGRSKVLSAV